MAVLEPQLREQLERALAEINNSLAASAKSRELVELLLGAGEEQRRTETFGTDTYFDLATKGSTLNRDPTAGLQSFSEGESKKLHSVRGWCGSATPLIP